MSDLHRRLRWTGVTLAVLALTGAGSAAGQEPPRRLSLDEALELARANNPAFLTTRNDRAAADWAVREAFGGLLPNASANAGAQWVDAGTQRFGIFTGDDIGAGTTDYYLSDYSLNLSYGLSAQTFAGISRARADRSATEAGIRAARFTLESAVTQQYLAALRARDQVRLTRQQLERAQENHELVSARVRVGAVVATDGKQAEVEAGRAEVALVQAENLLRAEKHRLMEQIGIVLDEGIELASEFAVFAPAWSREDLVARALDGNPRLRSFHAAESARDAGVWEARSGYMPSLFVSANWSGFTREIGDEAFLLGQARSSLDNQRESCLLMNQISAGLATPLQGFPRDCSGLVLTPQAEQALLGSNRAFPFDFTEQPLSLRLTVSVPIFQGFSRQRQVEEARNLARDARENRRAEELRLRTAVNTAYDDLMAQSRVVGIETRNREVATEQLELARERYRLGAAAYLELLEAQSSLAQAERDYLNAVYDFHNALSALEAAVGDRLLVDRNEP